MLIKHFLHFAVCQNEIFRKKHKHSFRLLWSSPFLKNQCLGDFCITSFSILWWERHKLNLGSRLAGRQGAGQRAVIKMYVVAFGPLVLRLRQAQWRMQSSSFPEPFMRLIAAASRKEKHQILMSSGQLNRTSSRLEKGGNVECFGCSSRAGRPKMAK